MTVVRLIEMKNEMTETRMTMNEGGEMSELHLEILAIQTGQLAQKERELRFIAANVDRLIEAMYEKAAQSRIGYAERDPYRLWRGDSICFDLRATGHKDLIFHTVEREVANGHPVRGGEA